MTENAQLSPAAVDKIAQLAKLKVPEDQKEAMAEQLSNILALFEVLASVETDAIEPLANPMEQTQRLRPDEVTAENLRETYQAIAPEVADGLYLVPQVIE